MLQVPARARLNLRLLRRAAGAAVGDANGTIVQAARDLGPSSLIFRSLLAFHRRWLRLDADELGDAYDALVDKIQIKETRPAAGRWRSRAACRAWIRDRAFCSIG